MGDEPSILGLGSAEARESFWRGLFDIHLDPLAFLDAKYRIVRVNNALADILGCRAQDLVGRHCYEVFHGDTCPTQSCPHALLLSDGCAHAEELTIAALGGIHWVSVTPVFDTEGCLVGALHIARNVSRYKALEAELRVARDAMAARAEARAHELKQHVRFEQLLVSLALDCGDAKSEADLRRLIQNGVAEIATMGGYDRCVFWQINDKDAQAIARYERPGVALEPLADVATSESAAWLFSSWERSGFVDRLSCGAERCVAGLPALLPGGLSFALQVDFLPEEQQNNMPMTPERLRLFCQVFGNALWRLANLIEMQRMRDELTHLDRVSRMGQLTAMLAHEINQPLAATLCNAQAAVRLLAQTPPDVCEVRSALDDIVENARRAGDVIQRTRALFKGDRQPVRKVDMHTLVERVCTLLHNEIALAGVEVEQQVGVSLPSVWGDEVQMQQVLLNLLGNAIDAVREKPKGQRIIAVSAEANAATRMLLLSVKDSGVGFLPGQEEMVFKPFHTTKPDGLGMGLSICRQIVESFGGHIRAARVPAGGTAFHVTLPLAVDAVGR